MALKKEKRKAISVNPGIMLLYGAPKVGKTTMLSKLDKCLIIDTEQGLSVSYTHLTLPTICSV